MPSAAEPAAAGDATDRTTAQRSLKSLGMPDAIETETLETPPLEETASLHLNGAGMPASLRGSLASLERQNARLETDGRWAHFPFHHLAEFYADYGTYDVTLDVPEGFTVVIAALGLIPSSSAYCLLISTVYSCRSTRTGFRIS